MKTTVAYEAFYFFEGKNFLGPLNFEFHNEVTLNVNKTCCQQ